MKNQQTSLSYYEQLLNLIYPWKVADIELRKMMSTLVFKIIYG